MKTTKQHKKANHYFEFEYRVSHVRLILYRLFKKLHSYRYTYGYTLF